MTISSIPAAQTIAKGEPLGKPLSDDNRKAILSVLSEELKTGSLLDSRVDEKAFKKIGGHFDRVPLYTEASSDAFSYTALMHKGAESRRIGAVEDPNTAGEYYIERQGGMGGLTEHFGPFAMPAVANDPAVHAFTNGIAGDEPRKFVNGIAGDEPHTFVSGIPGKGAKLDTVRTFSGTVFSREPLGGFGGEVPPSGAFLALDKALKLNNGVEVKEIFLGASAQAKDGAALSIKGSLEAKRWGGVETKGGIYYELKKA